VVPGDVQRCGGSIYEQERVGEERGGKETGGCPLTNPPPYANIIPCHFVLATKCRVDREKLKLETHLVANKQQQQYGLNYSETFTPTTNMTTICTILTL
jgi:hypothetical protein